ncbi:hypothetical protein [Rhodococcus sp. NCIMB 12038]|uniref:hypothetical protein n=1 Tax=Rhodococcus sp. NCIMB 12038 TaxID=933800 RepID=UPI000B3CC2A1|nr:hypothetical protein [Rhodococcus sp. NCIMB 12038]OUS97240.1 hypothetical protein CA951_02525 [Rhodococcus sp. NCIMB 12038]
MTAPTGSPSPIRRQAQIDTPAGEAGIKKRQPRGIAKARADNKLQEAAVAEEVATEVTDPGADAGEDGVDLGDRVFADVVPGPPAPNTQPPTDESKAAVAREATARRKAVTQGLRDRAVSDRLFSGENAKRSPKEKADILTARHTQYTQLMALNCIKPLAQGIDPGALTEAVSTAAVMWALSPRFRELMADYNTKLNDALRFTRAKVFAEKKQVPLGSSRSVVEQAQTAAEREDKAMLDQVSAVLRGAEAVPFSTESAAIALLQVHEDAYVAIREGDDEATIATDLRGTVGELTQIWKSQKLDPQLITATARTLAGHTEGDGDLRLAQFVETAGGSIRPSQQVAAPGAGGATVAAWGGQWSLATGGILNSASSPMFTVRGVSDARSHQDSLSTLVFQDLELAAKGGPEELRKAVIGHLAAWELRDTKLDVSGVGGASRDRAAACAQRSRVAYVAMADDGIEEDVRQKVATNALMKAMTAFETAHPDAVAAMAKDFGENHSEAVAQMVATGKERGRYAQVRPLVFDPSNPVHAAQMAEYNAPTAGPEPARELGVESPRPTALADWGPRAHPDVLAAEHTQRDLSQGRSVFPRIAKTEIEAQMERDGGDSAPNSRPPANGPEQPQQGLRREQAAPHTAKEDPAPDNPGPAKPSRSAAKQGGPEWRRVRQDDAAARNPRPPSMPGPETATVGQRHQAEAYNSGYDRTGSGQETKSTTGQNNPRIDTGEGRQGVSPQEHARRTRQAQNQLPIEGNAPKKPGGESEPDLSV